MPDRFDLFLPDEPRVGVVMGTGPGLTLEAVWKVRKLRRFAVNNALEFTCDVHLADKKWWPVNWDWARKHVCPKWTWDKATADQYGINWIEGKWAPGLSKDKSYIHYHHGSGPQMVNLAYHYGCKVILLIGWDMIFRGKNHKISYSEPRHYFGEDSITKNHWPNTGPNGELGAEDWGLIGEMYTIKPEDYGIEIINCTPDSAMHCFPEMDLDEAIKKYAPSAS